MEKNVKYLYDRETGKFYDIMQVGQACINFTDEEGYVEICFGLYDSGYEDFTGKPSTIVLYDVAMDMWLKSKNKQNSKVLNMTVKGDWESAEKILKDVKSYQNKIYKQMIDASFKVSSLLNDYRKFTY